MVSPTFRRTFPGTYVFDERVINDYNSIDTIPLTIYGSKQLTLV
jgi:hypothetical protein